MSINHLQETPWWQQQQSLMMESTQNSSTSNSNSSSSPSSSHKFQASAATPHPQFSSWPSPSPSPHHQQHYQQQQQHRLWLNSFDNNNNNNDPALGFINEQDIMTSRNANQEPQKEPMFEKPLTPSDVGKLNRLVIPKQHAEKYFPLGGGDSSSSSAEKGLLLSFEDESGKCWRFRYSYWNSSQSYVLTKGWSRYVKEKRLDAGDVIQFERHHTDCERLFIGWRRRGAPSAAHQDAHNNAGATSSGWPRGLGLSHYPVQTHAVTVPLFQHATAGVQGQTTSVGNSRTLRLFGVNLECQVDDEPESQAQHHRLQFSHNYSVEVEAAAAYASTNPPNHMDVTFSRDDVSQTRNRQG